MKNTRYAIQRLNSVIEQIGSILNDEFPFRHSKTALMQIKSFMDDRRQKLTSFHENSAPAIVQVECADALAEIFAIFPLLGFLKRSTNTRNAFEIFEPLADLATRLLEKSPSAKDRKRNFPRVVISSEWEYSPYVYHQVDFLPDYILVGFPACECENPLLIPLAGHEFGHPVWREYKLEDQLAHESLVQNTISEKIKAQWDDKFKTLFSIQNTYEEAVQDIFTNKGLSTFIAVTEKIAFTQCEEVFCDFLGLRLFGESYLKSYAYLCSPFAGKNRSCAYPNSKDRACLLMKAAEIYEITVPNDYCGMFENVPLTGMDQMTYSAVELADNAVKDAHSWLADMANQQTKIVKIDMPSEDSIAHILRHFNMLVPFDGKMTLPDVIAAGWRAFEKLDDMWKREEKAIPDFDKQSVLSDIILKNIEVIEVKKRWEDAKCYSNPVR